MEKKIQYAVGYAGSNPEPGHSVGVLYLKINKGVGTEVGEQGAGLNAKLFDTPEEAFEWAESLTPNRYPTFVVAVRIARSVVAVI